MIRGGGRGAGAGLRYSENLWGISRIFERILRMFENVLRRCEKVLIISEMVLRIFENV